MIIFISYLLKIIATILFSYLLWKKLKEDYAHEIIFSFTIISLLAVAFGSMLSKYITPGYDFWIVFILLIINIIWFVKRGHFKFYELLDALPITGLTFFLISNLSNLEVQKLLGKDIKINDLQNWLHLLFIFILLLLYKGVLKNFRSFTFYPSGKIGFLGLSVLSLYFLFRGLVAIIIPSVLRFTQTKGPSNWDASNIIDPALSFIVFIFLGIWIYVRSGRSLSNKLLVKLNGLAGALDKIFIWKW